MTGFMVQGHIFQHILFSTLWNTKEYIFLKMYQCFFLWRQDNLINNSRKRRTAHMPNPINTHDK